MSTVEGIGEHITLNQGFHMANVFSSKTVFHWDYKWQWGLNTKYLGDREENEESFLYHISTIEDLLCFWFLLYFVYIFFKYLEQNYCKGQGKRDYLFSSLLGGDSDEKGINPSKGYCKPLCCWCLYTGVTIYIKSVCTACVKLSMLDFRRSSRSIF